MLNKKSKIPPEVTMPTSPMLTPFLRYSAGRLRWGWGCQSGKPRLLGNKSRAYTSPSSCDIAGVKDEEGWLGMAEVWKLISG